MPYFFKKKTTNDSDKNSSDYDHKAVHRSIKFKVHVLQNLFGFFFNEWATLGKRG